MNSRAILVLLASAAALNAQVQLVKGRASEYVIYAGSNPDEGVRFAVSELQGYVNRISGCKLRTVAAIPRQSKVVAVGSEAAKVLGVDPSSHSKKADGFVKFVDDGRVVLAGNSRRATLYAVYSLLEDLGCRWYAPNFDYYGASGGEFVPRAASLSLSPAKSEEEPSLNFRSKRIEEGWSHNPARLKNLVDWMGKTRQNVLSCPIDYAHEGRVKWDNWRAELTPELKQRGILIDIGGHGYENLLPAEKYAKGHLDWFGMLDGKRIPDMRRVNFNTANPDAVRTFIDNILIFVRQHPEIDILSVIPPDTPLWDTSPESLKLGPISYRHALLANQMMKAVRKEFPNMRFQVPAYQALVQPPSGIRFEGNANVGVAAIRREDSRPIQDLSEPKNLYYLNYLWQWLDTDALKGDVAFASYYYRYAWRSLPVVMYSVIASDTRYVALAGASGGGAYSEPGDWFTYEVNHYVYAKVAWDAHASVETVLRDYCDHRFGPASTEMRDLFFLLDSFSVQIVRSFGDYTTLSSVNPFPELRVQNIFAEPFLAYKRQMALCRKLQKAALDKSAGDPIIRDRLEKWGLLLQYLDLELDAKAASENLAGPNPYAVILGRLGQIYGQMDALLGANKNKGIFLTENPRTNYSTAARQREAK